MQGYNTSVNMRSSHVVMRCGDILMFSLRDIEKQAVAESINNASYNTSPALTEGSVMGIDGVLRGLYLDARVF